MVELKEVLSPSSFNYLSENYQKQVEIYTFLSNLLLQYFREKSPIKNDTTTSFFNYQNLNFTNHLAEVEQITGLKSQIYNSQTIIQEVKRTPVLKKFALNPPKKVKYFRDFISNERNQEIEIIILEKFQNEKGKKLRYLIEFLNEFEIISLVHGDRKKIYDIMKSTFKWDVGTYQSIFGNWFSKPNKEYSKFKETLNLYFPFLIKL